MDETGISGWNHGGMAGFSLSSLVPAWTTLVQALITGWLEWNSQIEMHDCNPKSPEVVFVNHPWTHAENSMDTPWTLCGHRLNIPWNSILFHATHLYTTTIFPFFPCYPPCSILAWFQPGQHGSGWTFFQFQPGQLGSGWTVWNHVHSSLDRLTPAWFQPGVWTAWSMEIPSCSSHQWKAWTGWMEWRIGCREWTGWRKLTYYCYMEVAWMKPGCTMNNAWVQADHSGGQYMIWSCFMLSSLIHALHWCEE